MNSIGEQQHLDGPIFFSGEILVAEGLSHSYTLIVCEREGEGSRLPPSSAPCSDHGGLKGFFLQDVLIGLLVCKVRVLSVHYFTW